WSRPDSPAPTPGPCLYPCHPRPVNGYARPTSPPAPFFAARSPCRQRVGRVVGAEVDLLAGQGDVGLAGALVVTVTEYAGAGHAGPPCRGRVPDYGKRSVDYGNRPGPGCRAPAREATQDVFGVGVIDYAWQESNLQPMAP